MSFKDGMLLSSLQLRMPIAQLHRISARSFHDGESTTIRQAGLRIAVIGNQGAYGYRLCRWLRELDEDARLILLSGADQEERDEIRNYAGAVSGGAEDWIAEYTLYDERFARLAQEFDVVLSVGPSGLKVANRAGGLPFVHFSMGSDLFEFPTAYTLPATALGRFVDRLWHRCCASPMQRALRTSAINNRLALQRVSAVFSDFRPAIQAAEQLGIREKLRLWALPEDVARNRRWIDQQLLKELTARYCQYQITPLWLSRVNFVEQDSGHYKGAEHFLKALETLYRERPGQIRAVVAGHGSDHQEFRRRAAAAGIDTIIDYVPHLPLQKIFAYLALPNAILCDGLTRMRNTTSGLTREAVSVGAPLVTHVDPELMRFEYGSDLPIYWACDEQTCFHALSRYADMSHDERNARREQVAEWAAKHLDFRVIMPQLIRVLREQVYLRRIARDEKRFRQPRETVMDAPPDRSGPAAPFPSDRH